MNYIFGAFGGIAFVHALEWLNPQPPTDLERINNMVKMLDPRPEAMHIDPEMIEIFHDLSKYRKYDEKAFVRCQKQADRVCFIALRVDRGELESSSAVCSIIQRCQSSSLKELAKIYKKIKISEQPDIEARSKSQAWRHSARNIGNANANANALQPKDTDSDETKSPTMKDKLKHDIVRMYYGNLMKRLSEHVVHVSKMSMDSIKNTSAPIPGSARRDKTISA